MNNFREIRKDLERLAELANRLKELASALRGERGEEVREQLKARGRSAGLGLCMAVLGAGMALVASIYLMVVVILILDLIFGRLWLSSLITVFGALIIGGILALLGIRKTRGAISELPAVGGGVFEEMRKTGDEIMETVSDLQQVAKKEVEASKARAREIAVATMELAPYLLGMYLTFKIMKGTVSLLRSRGAEDWEG